MLNDNFFLTKSTIYHFYINVFVETILNDYSKVASTK